MNQIEIQILKNQIGILKTDELTREEKDELIRQTFDILSYTKRRGGKK